jgi:hypothetical protein
LFSCHKLCLVLNILLYSRDAILIRQIVHMVKLVRCSTYVCICQEDMRTLVHRLTIEYRQVHVVAVNKRT